MKQIRQKVGGLDIHRDSVVACTRVTAPDGSIEVAKGRFKTTQAGLAELTAFLMDAGVNTVAMEATGIYWRPIYYALEGLFEELWLCNAQHVKNVPGRKTDLSDAEWLADVAAHGMVRPSFVPPPDIRELRELTRYRKTQVDARAKEIQWRSASQRPFRFGSMGPIHYLTQRRPPNSSHVLRDADPASNSGYLREQDRTILINGCFDRMFHVKHTMSLELGRLGRPG